MKPAIHNETIELIKAWARGDLKAQLAAAGVSYPCAMQRMSRFRREHPAQYRRIIRLSTNVKIC